MGRFHGKNNWGIILGASSGMGLATARKLASEGMNLILVYRERRSKQEEIDQAFDNLRKGGASVMGYNTDATNEEKVLALVEEIKKSIGDGKVKLLLHSIAKGNLKLLTNPPENSAIEYPPQYLNPSDFALTSESMAFSLVLWIRKLDEADLIADHAQIIGLTSAGDQRVWKGYGAVAAAKSALETIIKYTAVEFSHKNINANVIEAGVTPTASMKMIPGSDQMIEKLATVHPKNRLTSPEDVANVVFLLTLDEAHWINGARIVVDGGESLI